MSASTVKSSEIVLLEVPSTSTTTLHPRQSSISKHYGESTVNQKELSSPRASTDLERGESVLRETSTHISNTQQYGHKELFAIKASVVPKILFPTLILGAWASWWSAAYMVLGWKSVGVQNQLIGIISVVMGLLLVFRTNTAYDRFWEARRLWGTLFSHTRNLTRLIWVHCAASEEKDLINKFSVTNLILAFAVAVKHHLREESGYKYDDLHNLLIHLPDYRPGAFHPKVANLPLLITHHIASYTTFVRKNDKVDIPSFAAMVASVSGMVDCLSNFERIRNCPIPLAYSIHLKQTLFVYLLSLPFQLVISMGWATIPLVFIASFTLLGIEAIGGEIENPFGYDPNDLRVDEFCNEIRTELALFKDHPISVNPTQWETPVDITAPEYSTFIKINQFRTGSRKAE